MINRRNLIAGAAAFASAIPAINAAEARVPRRTVDFGPDMLDIYAPFGARDLPVLIYVHGGAWMIGNRNYVHSLPEFAAALGMVLVSLDYRKLPLAKVPAQKRDVAAGINWVRKTISGYGGDPARLVVMGHSAGAHLAALSILDGSAGQVSALICNDVGAYDIQALADIFGGDLPALYKPAFSNKAEWTQLSPASYIGQRQVPPVLVTWSKVEHHPALSQAFAEKLRAAGGDVEEFDGSARYSHRTIISELGTRRDGITKAVADFIAEHV